MSKLTRFARGQQCALRILPAGCDPETVTLHHYRRRGWGMVGAKPHDIFGVHACDPCHRHAHAHPRDPVVIERTLDGMIETQLRALAAGLVEVK